MWSVNLYTDEKSASRAKVIPYGTRPSWRIRTYWHMRYVRLTGGRMRHVWRRGVSGLRVRLRKARGYWAHTDRRIRAGLPQRVSHPYVRIGLSIDYIS